MNSGGKKPLQIWLALPLLLLFNLNLAAQANPSAPRLDFDAFSLLSERNIFDPNRSSRRAPPPPAEASTNETVEVPTQSFALLGIISYQKGVFAFFDGSSSDYRGTLKSQDTIAGYKITQIGSSSVRLEAGGESVDLPVGMQMTREEEGKWQVMARSEPAGDSERDRASFSERGSEPDSRRDDRRDSRGDSRDRDSSRSRSSSSSSSRGSAGSASSADESEILKALMQKREQELKNEKD